MDLSTTYLGLELKNPFVPSSSPLSKQLDTARALEDHGAAALVMYSLFEEEIEAEEGVAQRLQNQDIGHGEAASYLPVHDDLPGHREKYLEQLRRLKEALEIPVIASLNGISPGGWVRHAKALEQAGADALELNVYYVAANIEEDGAAVERRVIETLTQLRKQVRLPLSVKLSPQFSAIGNLVRQIEAAGADGVALFNRFYQPDIDTDDLELDQTLHLSTSADSLLAMRWIAILHGRVGLSLAATGGVHTAEDAIKLLLCGADVTYLCSSLLSAGPGRLDEIHAGVLAWLDEHEYESVAQLKGSLSQKNSPDPGAYERGNYIRLLSSYRVPQSLWR
ncbi:MAG: dihydroorotate dehydrogenase-like protein [Gammaproteobacteria bacterium]